MNPSTTERSEYKQDSKGQAEYWHDELRASQKMLEKCHTKGNKVVNRFLDKRHEKDKWFRLNLFHSNIKTLQSMLYGNLPKVDASRRFADADDDIGRVSAEILERLLNLDIEQNGAEYDSVLRAVLQDRLLPGLGCARVRYEVETEMVPDPNFAPAVDFLNRPLPGQQPPLIEKVVYEDAPIDYYHWRDVLWGWARTWSEIPWIAFRSYLDKDEVRERFDDKVADSIEFHTQTIAGSNRDEHDSDLDDPLQKAEIWEIWDKVKNEIVWVCLTHDRVLDTKEDTLGLEDFFPCPPFLFANQTTTLYIPTSDFHMAEDLYNEVDRLQTRISIITEAVKVVGVYDRSATNSVGRMLKEGTENDLIPVDNWAMFGEKNGLKGCIDWLPLEEVVGTLEKLRVVRDETIQLLYQVTGMSDIMRGKVDNAREGVGQSELKAKFGSIRVQALQEEFARFASDLLQIKAEIITKHFDPETIVKKSNIMNTKDQEFAQQAVMLLKDPNGSQIRVDVRPESVAMIDYAKLREERTDYMKALATFMQSSTPLMQMDKRMGPYILELLQWGLSGFKGSQQIEAVLDQAISGMKKDKQKQEPNPEQMKMQAEMKMFQAKQHSEMQKMQADHQAKMQQQNQQFQNDMQKMRADFENDMAIIQTKAQADVGEEQQTSQINAQQRATDVQLEMQRDEQEHRHNVVEEDQSHENKMDELRLQGSMRKRPNDS